MESSQEALAVPICNTEMSLAGNPQLYRARLSTQQPQWDVARQPGTPVLTQVPNEEQKEFKIIARP